MNLQEAITHCNEIADKQCNQCEEEHKQLAKWLKKLAWFEDKTDITEEWLCKNGFEFIKANPAYEEDEHYLLDCNDTYVSAILNDKEIYKDNWWEVSITTSKHGDTEMLSIRTLGQLKMFLSICGLDEIVERLKD